MLRVLGRQAAIPPVRASFRITHQGCRFFATDDDSSDSLKPPIRPTPPGSQTAVKQRFRSSYQPKSRQFQNSNQDDEDEMSMEEANLLSKHFMQLKSQIESKDLDLSPDHEELVSLQRRKLSEENDGEEVSDDDIELNPPPLVSTTKFNRTVFDAPYGTYDSSALDYTNNKSVSSFAPTPTDHFKHKMNKFQSRKHATPLPKDSIHFMNLPLLKRFVSPNGSILGRSQTGLNGTDQRKVARAIKRARAVGIIPFIGGWEVEYGSLGATAVSTGIGKGGKE